MNRFWALFEESVIVQALIALGVIGTICYLYATGQEVPQELVQIAMLILGFYFGTKVQQTLTKRGG